MSRIYRYPLYNERLPPTDTRQVNLYKWNMSEWLTSSDSKTWQQILDCLFWWMRPSAPVDTTGPRRAITTRMSPMSAMYEMVLKEWSIITSWNKHLLMFRWSSGNGLSLPPKQAPLCFRWSSGKGPSTLVETSIWIFQYRIENTTIVSRNFILTENCDKNVLQQKTMYWCTVRHVHLTTYNCWMETKTWTTHDDTHLFCILYKLITSDPRYLCKTLTDDNVMLLH